MEELTREQAAVVADRNADILVSAGAGSGKTRVLVERYVALLADCRIPEIAAVTFTDAAATEMRERVRREVRGRPELAGHLPDIDQAVIGTIHALCLQVLREHPVAAGAIAAARILPDDEAEYERIGAALDALEDAAQADDGRALAIRELDVFPLSEQLPRMIERRDEVRTAFGRLAGSTVDDWSRHVRRLLDASLRDAVDAERPELERLVADLRRAHAGAAPADKLAQQVGGLLDALGDPLPEDPGRLAEALAVQGPLIKVNVGSQKNWEDVKLVKEHLKSVREAARRLQEAPRWEAYEADALRVAAALQALFQDACRRYRTRKAELSACDYLDLELEAIRLLDRHPEIAARYRARLRHVMVDEAQDLNETQVRLLRLLTGGNGSGPQRFLVGDAKQSIYRFRGSDVAHFNRYEEEIGRAGGSVRALTQSFRTHDEMVSVCNALFERVFEAGADGPGSVRMQPMSGRGPAGGAGPHLTVIPVARAPAGSDGSADANRRRVEADVVAGEIAALLDGGAAVWDGSRGCERPSTPRDVAVLLRRLANVHVFEQALEGHGVPYVTPAGAGFFTRQEVRDLTNLLAWLSEPDDHIALVGALRSPLFMIDDRTLEACHAADRSWTRVLAHPPDGVAGAARRRCTHAAAVLEELRDAAALEPPDAIVERALALTGFEAAWAPLRGGEQALANIRKLVTILRTLAGRSIDETVTYLRRRRDELVDREGLAVVDRTDAVRLLTIHGAKGLEFPIVFVPEAHVRAPETHDSIRWRVDDGISVTLKADAASADERRRRPGLYRYLLDLDRREEDAEYRRLLYVAATRAADRLYLSGDDGGRERSWLAMCRDGLRGMDPSRVEMREPAPVDLGTIARAGPPAEVAMPPASDERTVDAPLVDRPAVIPLRASTPVTSLRPPSAPVGFSGSARSAGHGDGLALVRGTLAHEAIRVWFTTGTRPELRPLLGRLHASTGDPAALRAMAEVDVMLDRFDGSELAQALRSPGTRAHFELPFGWYWDGAPVHGTIDLAYEHEGRWHLVDFKTDDVTRGRLKRAAAPYLGQVALYAAALQQAVGHAPAATLYFLRPGVGYLPDPDELREALAATRSRIDAGAMLAEPEP